MNLVIGIIKRCRSLIASGVIAWLWVVGLALVMTGCPAQNRQIRRQPDPVLRPVKPKVAVRPAPRAVKPVGPRRTPSYPPDDNPPGRDTTPRSDAPLIAKRIPLPSHRWFRPFVKRWFKRNGGFVKAVMRRRGMHIDIYRKVIKSHGLPMDILYVAAVESNFRPKARSVAHAVGVWQFIASTGRRYGLKINKWRDDRSNVYKSTVAAARYLTDLYKEFGQWELAFAGYNCGENCVRRVLRRCPNMSFWDMRKLRRCRIPRETRMYVPLIFALMYLERNPPRGYANIKMYKNIRLEKVSIQQPVSLLEVASALSVSVKDVQAWNPSLRSWATPPIQQFDLLVPPEYKRSLMDYLEYPKKDAILLPIRVRSRSEMNRVARRYGMKTQLIASINQIPRRSRQFKPQTILVPAVRKGKGYWKRKKQWLSEFSKELKKFEPSMFASRRKRRKRRKRRPIVCHWVQPGDSYWHIGHYYGVSYLKLARYNRRVRVLRPGIYIKLKPRARCRKYRRIHKVRYYSRGKKRRRSRYTRYRRSRRGRRYARRRKEPAYKKRWFYQVDGDFRPIKRRRSRRSRRRYSRRSNRRRRYDDSRNRRRRSRRSRRSRRRVASRYRRRRSRSCHKVRRGDSLWKLAKKYKLSYSKLLRYNRRSKRLYVGRYVKLRNRARCPRS